MRPFSKVGVGVLTLFTLYSFATVGCSKKKAEKEKLEEPEPIVQVEEKEGMTLEEKLAEVAPEVEIASKEPKYGPQVTKKRIVPEKVPIKEEPSVLEEKVVLEKPVITPTPKPLTTVEIIGDYFNKIFQPEFYASLSLKSRDVLTNLQQKGANRIDKWNPSYITEFVGSLDRVLVHRDVNKEFDYLMKKYQQLSEPEQIVIATELGQTRKDILAYMKEHEKEFNEIYTKAQQYLDEYQKKVFDNVGKMLVKLSDMLAPPEVEVAVAEEEKPEELEEVVEAVPVEVPVMTTEDWFIDQAYRMSPDVGMWYDAHSQAGKDFIDGLVKITAEEYDNFRLDIQDFAYDQFVEFLQTGDAAKLRDNSMAAFSGLPVDDQAMIESEYNRIIKRLDDFMKKHEKGAVEVYESLQLADPIIRAGYNNLVAMFNQLPRPAVEVPTIEEKVVPEEEVYVPPKEMPLVITRDDVINYILDIEPNALTFYEQSPELQPRIDNSLDKVVQWYNGLKVDMQKNWQNKFDEAAQWYKSADKKTLYELIEMLVP